jgi:arabinofuranan 3-O-arabinosyltransferase
VQAADSIAGAPGRTLLLPGLPQADFSWGYTAEEPLSWLTNESWASRSLIPLGSYGAIQYLDAVERAVARGGDPQLAKYLARGGFARVMVRNDGNWRTYGAPSPGTINDALGASGVRHTESFGPEIDEAQIGARLGTPLHEMEMFDVPQSAADGRIATYSAADTAVVSGDSSAPLVLDGWASAERGLILASDVHAGDALPSQWIITDGNQRRFTNFGATRHNRSYVLAPDETAPSGVAASEGLYPGTRLQDETVAVRDGVVGLEASSSGSLVRSGPETAPDRALDHDSTTAWMPAVELPLAGQWLQVDLPQPTSVSSIDVQLLTPADHPDAVGTLRVSTENGVAETVVDPSALTQRVAAPAGMTKWVRVTLGSINPGAKRAGIRELTIAGVAVEQRLRVPSQLVAAYSGTSHPIPTYVFSRGLPNPVSPDQEDAETALNRRFTVPHAGSVEINAKVVALPGSAALDLLDARPGFSITASSTLGSAPRFAPRNLVDGDDTTTWAAGVLADGITLDKEPRISLRWNEPRALDRLVIRAAPGYSLPPSVQLTTKTETRTAELANDGEASFAPMSTNEVTVDFAVRPASAGVTNARIEAPTRVRLAALEFPALRDLTPGRIDPEQPVIADCSQGPAVEVASQLRRFSVHATVADVINQRPVDASPCDESPLRVEAGEQDLTTPPVTSLFVIAQVQLIDPQLVRQNDTARSRFSEVQAWNGESRRILVSRGEAIYLAVNENANDGWHAKLNGRDLESVVLDGWRQGYLVPAGEGGVVEVHYQPSSRYRTGLIAGLVLVVLLIVGRLLPTHRTVPASLSAGRWPRWLAIVGPCALAVIIGGPFALAAIGLMTLRRPPPRPIPVVALLLLVAATAGTALRYKVDDGALWGSNSTLVSAFTVGALMVLASTLLPARENGG